MELYTEPFKTLLRKLKKTYRVEEYDIAGL